MYIPLELLSSYLAVVEGCPDRSNGTMTHYLDVKINKDSACKVKVNRRIEDIPLTSSTQLDGSSATSKQQQHLTSVKKVGINPNSRDGYSTQLAVLHWKVLATKPACSSHHKSLSLVEVELVTGRRHQIRAQFSYEGFPIVGDTLYHPTGLERDIAGFKQGAKSHWQLFTEKKAIALHACHLSIPHPLPSRGVLNLHAKVPALWHKVFEPHNCSDGKKRGGSEAGLASGADRYILTL